MSDLASNADRLKILIKCQHLLDTMLEVSKLFPEEHGIKNVTAARAEINELICKLKNRHE